MNAPAKIANVWFPPHQRAIATSVLSVLNPVGSGVGFVVSGIIDNTS